MKNLVLVVLVSLGLCNIISANENIINGNFSSGSTAPWTPSTNVAVTTSGDSPFTNVYGSNSKCMQINKPSGSKGYVGGISFGGLSANVVSVNFDFKLQYVNVSQEVLAVQKNLGVANATIFELGTSASKFTLLDGTGNTDMVTLVANTWYNVSAAFNMSTWTYSGSITQYGGSTVSWTNRALQGTANSLGQIIVDEANPTGGSNTVYLDNISVQTASNAKHAAMLHNGVPYFPIGVYGSPTPVGQTISQFALNHENAVEMAAAGFNNYSVPMANLTNSELNYASQYGLSIMAHCADAPIKYMWYTSEFVVGSSFDQQIQAVKSNPALLAYYGVDEPYARSIYCEPGYDWLSVLTSGKSFVASEDPNHSVMINETSYAGNVCYSYGGYTFTDQGFANYTAGGDIYGMDTYPYNGSTSDLTYCEKDVDNALHLTGSAKPIISCLQGQANGEADGNYSFPRPDITATRFMAYSTIIHGTNGIYWWGLDWIDPSSQLWKDIKSVAHELNDIQDVLTNGTEGNTFTLGDYNLEGTLKTYNGYNYLIVANKSFSTISSATISATNFVPANNGGKVVVAFESGTSSTRCRLITASGTSWTDSFVPWGVHVYTDKPTILRPARNDFDADGRSDVNETYIGADNVMNWNTLTSRCTDKGHARWGGGSDIPVVGDFDGDGMADYGVFSSGTWLILKSSTGDSTYYDIPWGCASDIPVVGDFDGDGRSDIAVFSGTNWNILKSSSNFMTSMTYSWGNQANGDIPVCGDFDGDGKIDIAVFSGTTWKILKSSSNYTTSVTYTWGNQANGDIPVVGDFDGDDIDDIAYYNSGYWYVLKSSSNFTTSATYQFGNSGDTPVSGDYDGDGIADLAVVSNAIPVRSELFANGDFAGSTLSPWQVLAGSASISTTDNSPSNGVYANNGRCMAINKLANTLGLTAAANFASVSGGMVRVNYDFKLSVVNGSGEVFAVQDSTGNACIFVMDGASNYFVMYDGSPLLNLAPLSANTWYNVQMNLNLATWTYSGCLTAYGGSSYSWTQRSLSGTPSAIGGLYLDESNPAAGAKVINYDNFSVAWSPSTPGELFTNGDFSGSTVNPWQVLAGSASVSATVNSAFPGVYPNNGRCMVINKPNNSIGLTASVGFIPVSNGLVKISYEFCLSSVTGSGEIFAVMGSGVPCEFIMDGASNKFIMYDGGPEDDLATLSANTWYNVQMTLDLDAWTYDGCLTAYAGPSYKWVGRALSGTPAAISSLYLDESNPVSPAKVIYYDNFAVAPMKEWRTLGSASGYTKGINSYCFDTLMLDTTTTAPSGSVVINSGSAYCNSTSVTLTCSATAAGSGVYQMRFSNDNATWGAWVAYSTSSAWTLSTGDGTKTVYAQYRDGAGNVTTAGITDTIILDTTLPVAGLCNPPASVTTATISVPHSGASDGGSGLNRVELWYKKETGGTWTNSGLTDSAGSGTFTFTPSSGSGWYYFGVVAQDNAGNRSATVSGSGNGSTIFKLWWSDGFESNNFTTGGWTNSGCTIQSTYVNSGTYAAQFKSTNSLTKSYSTSGKTSIIVQYARYGRNGPSSGHFIADWSTNGTTWTTLEDFTGTSAWTTQTYTLPTGANNQSGFRIRFRVTGYSSSQYAYLDDVKIIGL